MCYLRKYLIIITILSIGFIIFQFYNFIHKLYLKFKLERYLLKKNIFIITNDFCHCKDYRLNKFINFTIECLTCNNKRIINFEKENDIYYLLDNIKDSITFIIHTNGGESDLPNFLAYILKQKKIFVKTYIPQKALSAGSFIALSSNIIFMNWYSCMGPIDTQINYDLGNEDEFEESFPAKFIKDVIKKNNAIVKLKAMEAESYHQDDIFLLSKMFGKKKSKIIMKNFLNTKLSHSIRFGPKDLKNFGLNVKIGIPDEINNIFKTFLRIKEI